MEPAGPTTPIATRTLRIFISSPGDVEAEREKARQVAEQLQRWYGDAVHLELLLWEQLPLEIDESFQDGIDPSLGDIDIAVFILWSRLGTPVGEHASGTEREFHLMLKAHEASGGERPDILFYRRDDDDSFQKYLATRGPEEIRECLNQNEAAKAFIRTHFWDEEGKNKRAYHGYHAPVEFGGLLKVHLRGLIDRQLDDGALRAQARWTEGAPYRGLETFHLEHADIFFGRETEVCDLENQLRQREAAEKEPAFVAVIGSSGSGKSSLVRAGLRASLTRFNLDETVAQWRSMVMIPGQARGDLFGALVQQLAQDERALPEIIGQGLSLEDLEEAMRESVPATFRTVIKPALVRASVAAGGVVKLLVIVDQFEEIFTDKTIGEENRERFLEGLDVLAQSGLCWVTVTMRSDFYQTAQQSESFLRLKGKTGQFDLRPPGTEALRRIITEPARMAGLRFEKRAAELGGQTLAGKILEDARNQSDLLPLLSDLLLELYQHRTKDNVIPFSAYEAFAGEDRTGLEGVLSARAEAVYGGLEEKAQKPLPEILHALVTVEGESDVRRRANLDALRDTADKAALVDAFIAARLLTAEGNGAGAQVSLAHEALLRKWDRVADWVTENRQHLRIRSRVEQAMRRWANKGEDLTLLLPEGLDLEEGVSLLRDAPELIAGGEYEGVRDYIERSRKHHADRAKQARRRRRTVTFFLVLLLLAATGGGFLAMRQRDEARYNVGQGWMLRARVAEERQKRYPDTLLYAAQAIGFDGLGREDQASTATLPERFQGWWKSVTGREDYIRYFNQRKSPREYQDARDWIADRPVYLPIWSSETLSGAPVTALAADPSGKWLALGSKNGVRLLDPAAKTEISLPDVSGITDLDFDPAGATLAIAAAEGIRIWDVAEAGYREAPQGQAGSLAWSPDGESLAGAGEDGAILLWTGGKGLPQRIEGALAQPATSLTFSPENGFLAGVEPGAGPRLFFPEHGAAASAWLELGPAKAEKMANLEKENFQKRVDLASAATAVAVDPDGKWLAVGTRDGNVVLWDAQQVTGRAQVSPEQRHAVIEPDGERRFSPVTAVAFRPDGAQLASAAQDGTIKLWEIRESALAVRATLTGHVGAVTAVSYAPGGQILASAGADGSAKLWDVSGRKLESPDLFAYLNREWYGFTPEASWKAGREFANLQPGELAGRWTGGETRDLAAEIQTAVEAKRWKRVELLARQVAELPPEVKEALKKARPKENPELGDKFVNAEGMDLLWCPPGTFTMGDTEQWYAKPHQVTLTRGVWLARTEVTQEVYREVMGTNPSTYTASGLQAPVENLNWFEAVAFCQRLTDRERARGTIRAGWEYRLPTEAQWEYACRAGTTTPYSFGDEVAKLHEFGNYNEISGNFTGSDGEHDDGHKYTAPVGCYPENPWGFVDMHGNVDEWCLDSVAWSAEAWRNGEEGSYQDGVERQDPVFGFDGTGALRVSRGGGFSNSAATCRSGYRNANQPTIRNSYLGFRPALVPGS